MGGYATPLISLEKIYVLHSNVEPNKNTCMSGFRFDNNFFTGMEEIYVLHSKVKQNKHVSVLWV